MCGAPCEFASACFTFEAQGIGIVNPNKFSGVFFFGTFLLDKQKKDTCYRSATGSAVRPKPDITIYMDSRLRGNDEPSVGLKSRPTKKLKLAVGVQTRKEHIHPNKSKQGHKQTNHSPPC